MSSHEQQGFRCGIYGHRPDGCRRYPWDAAQVVFDECVYVDAGALRTHEEMSEILGGADAVTAACQRCGRCCFGWSRTRGGELQPVVRCSHLRGGVGDSVDKAHTAMAGVRRTHPFA